MDKVKVGDYVMVTCEDKDHPFEVGDLVRIISIHDLGIVYGKSQDGVYGYLIPIEYMRSNKPKKLMKPEQLEMIFFD